MKIESTGFGKFTATNGVDVLTAEYERGKRHPDGKYHPYWKFSCNGNTWFEYVGKDAAITLAKKHLTDPIETPLTEEEALTQQQQENCVHEIVGVGFDEVLGREPSYLYRLLNDRLCDIPLVDLSYRIVGIADDGNTLHIRVTGFIPLDELTQV